MIFSMTGYGKAEKQVANNKKLIVEVRSLNSKSLDLNVRIAPQLRSKELEIRTLIGQRLERGKIDLSIYYQDAAQSEEAASYTPINREAFAYYIAGQGREHHSSRSGSDSGYSYEKSEQFSFILCCKSVVEFFVFTEVMVNISCCLRFSVQSFICLK